MKVNMEKKMKTENGKKKHTESSLAIGVGENTRGVSIGVGSGESIGVSTGVGGGVAGTGISLKTVNKEG